MKSGPEHMKNLAALPVRILGLDPGLRRTGWGVIDCAGSRMSLVAHGVVAVPDTLDLAERLHRLLLGIEAVVAAHAPHEAAVEEVFVNANGQSTLKLGQARACSLLAPRPRRPARGGVQHSPCEEGGGRRRGGG